MKLRILNVMAMATLLAPAAPAQDPGAKPATDANTVVRMKTSMGDIDIELDSSKAPATVENFLKYVEDKFYDGTVFHRVIDGFMIQGGGFAKSGDEVAEKETRSPIKNEANNGLKNTRGSIAMARTSDPNSATAQFFINVVDNAGLDHPRPDGYGYAVFGRVIKGIDVVDKIKAADTGVRNLKSRTPSGQLIAVPMRDVPTEDIVIESITVGTAEEKAEEAPAEQPPAATDPAPAPADEGEGEAEGAEEATPAPAAEADPSGQ